MKKGEIIEGYVERVDFPNKGIVNVDGQKVIVKNTICGQKVKARINKKRSGRAEGALLEVIEKSPVEIEPMCPHFSECGGCTYQNLSYDEQLKLKESQVENIIRPVLTGNETVFEPIKSSPVSMEYRNKMEYTFGDEYRDGPLALGMHKRGSFYDIVTTGKCKLVHEDFRKILLTTLVFFSERGIKYYHRVRHDGYLRHLLVRRSYNTGEILIDLITTTELVNDTAEEELLSLFANELLNLEKEGKLSGKIKGILHTKNDSVADTVINQGTEILFGQDFFYEELMGLKFKITPFSFFQTNTKGAEVLYSCAREYAMEALSQEAAHLGKKPVIFDLYSGTGTIAQMMAGVAERVTGVEIVEEAVVAAKENAKLNNLNNCEFLAGDVLKVLDNLHRPEDKPDIIILDPPRDGCHPKALPKILEYGAPSIIYISCKVTSLARDLIIMQEQGYEVKKVVGIDQFPATGHVETVVLMSKVK